MILMGTRSPSVHSMWPKPSAEPRFRQAAPAQNRSIAISPPASQNLCDFDLDIAAPPPGKPPTGEVTALAARDGGVELGPRAAHGRRQPRSGERNRTHDPRGRPSSGALPLRRLEKQALLRREPCEGGISKLDRDARSPIGP